MFACIAAVVATRVTVECSYRVGLEQLTGTLIGAIWGLGLALLAQNNAYLIFAGIVAVIWSTNLLKRQNSAGMASIVFLGIMINLGPQTPLELAFYRVVETSVGIGVAVAVNMLLFPKKEK